MSGPVTKPLPRLPRMSLRAFRARHFRPGHPAVLEGAIGDWPALGRWTDAALIDRLGDRLVPAYEMEAGRIRLDPARGFVVRTLPFADYVRRLHTAEGPTLYLRAPLLETLPELAEDIRTPEYCALGHRVRRNLWFSAPTTVTHCHFDLPDNLIACVRGAKRFLLFAPSQGRNLYRHAAWSSVPHLARVDLDAPDVDRFPRLSRARGYEVELRPGDLLYVPARWWHWARSEDVTLTVNFWFSSPLTAVVLAASDWYKRLRALNI